MKTLSESLEGLAGRVKVLEDSATATFEANRTKLEQRRLEIDATIEGDLDELDSALREASVKGRTFWDDTKAAIKRPLAELRTRVETRKAEHELHRAERHAIDAEEDAAAAIEAAAYFLNIAEYAVIDAALARMVADDLSAAAPVATAGASS